MQFIINLKPQKLSKMEKKKEYNQPAFPSVDVTDGMTLLDYMAAKAMNAIVMVNPEGSTEYWAEASYRTAAAMLEERKKYINS